MKLKLMDWINSWDYPQTKETIPVCVYQKPGKVMIISQDVLESMGFGHDIYSLE